LLDWKPVAAGDFFSVPPGTIHAIGSGIALLEFQQNADITYRLYDYGRPRELQLDDGIAVAAAAPYSGTSVCSSTAPRDTILLNGPEFSLVRSTDTDGVAAALSDRLRWVAPLQGFAFSADESATAGECLLVEPNAPLSIGESSVVLIGIGGSI
jgi:mannose-6-phosphate isomerase